VCVLRAVLMAVFTQGLQCSRRKLHALQVRLFFARPGLTWVRCSCTPDYVEHPGDAFIRKHNFKVGAEPLNPVILVPGTGTRLLALVLAPSFSLCSPMLLTVVRSYGQCSGGEARSGRPSFLRFHLLTPLSQEEVPEWYCWKKWDWYGLWLSLYEIMAQTCAFNNLEVNFHPENYTYTNQTGVQVPLPNAPVNVLSCAHPLVQIRPRDFGGLQGVRFLDDFLDDPLHLTGIYETMIEALEAIGYVVRACSRASFAFLVETEPALCCCRSVRISLVLRTTGVCLWTLCTRTPIGVRISRT
jgi:hypothetical protein